MATRPKPAGPTPAPGDSAWKAGRSFAPRPLLAGSRALAEVIAADSALLAVTADPRTGRILIRAGATLVSRRLHIWQLPGSDAARLVPRLIRLGLLRYAEPNRPLSAATHLDQGDPAIPLAWHLFRVGADLVEPPGPGVPLTVIDSGLDVTHLEFASRPNVVLLNQQSADSLDPGAEAHGTMVASTAAAPSDGIGTVGIYPQAVLRSYDAGEPTTASLLAGIEAAIDAGPGIINLSLGRPAGSESDRAEYEAVIVALGTGSLVVASSGNEFLAGDPRLVPATLPHVLTVAATDLNDDPSAFSSSSFAVDLAAPGQDIPFGHPTDPTLYTLVDGTSFSSPIVAAAAAWIWTARPDLDITQLYDLIRFSARDVSDPGFDERTGFGVLDIPEALAEAPPSVDPQEPNDDIDQIVAGGIFPEATPALAGRRSFSARLDLTEDPDDVYRILVPPRRKVTITVAGVDANIGAILWSEAATTVYDERCRKCLAVSNRRGNQAERLVWRNTTRKRKVVFLDVWLPDDAELTNPDYRITLRTSR